MEAQQKPQFHLFGKGHLISPRERMLTAARTVEAGIKCHEDRWEGEMGRKEKGGMEKEQMVR